MKTFKDFKKLREDIKNNLRKPDEVPDRKVWEEWKNSLNLSSEDIDQSIDENTGDNLPSDIIERSKTLSKMTKNGKTYEDAESNWSDEMWSTCRKRNLSVKKTLDMRTKLVGNPFEKEGKKTKWLKTLMMLGHDPRKHK